MLRLQLKTYLNKAEELMDKDPYCTLEELLNLISWKRPEHKDDLKLILNGEEFFIENDTLIRPLIEDLESYVIPDNVKIIGEDAFDTCHVLKSIIIPDSVVTIEKWAFFSCNSLTSVVLGNSLKSIEYNAFSGCSNLKNLTIPSNVTTIGNSAFYSCTGLTNVTIGENVTSIGEYAFRGCNGLKNITYKGTKSQWNAITKSVNWNDNTGNYTVHCLDGDIQKNKE